MIKHIVLLKFKKDAQAEGIVEIENKLGTLPGEIPEIKSYEFGRDVVRSERSYDFALISVFEDTESLKRYQIHPRHQEVLKTIKELCESIVVADFVF
ncbi:MAG: Dabb family protein [Pseudomonadota bacterium]|nr:Dabb family protein [Pseudomonadota bacterium]MBU1398038.1 Dabb family protein [Pseudomonadota bacterium]MBU1571075.1 Dabb family protein [Pseudomonadota bacterium]